MEIEPTFSVQAARSKSKLSFAIAIIQIQCNAMGKSSSLHQFPMQCSQVYFIYDTELTSVAIALISHFYNRVSCVVCASPHALAESQKRGRRSLVNIVRDGSLLCAFPHLSVRASERIVLVCLANVTPCPKASHSVFCSSSVNIIHNHTISSSCFLHSREPRNAICQDKSNSSQVILIQL